MKKAGKILAIILGVLAALVALVLFGARLFFRLPVSSYYSASEKSFIIPGLNHNFVAQGISYDADSDIFLVAGYQTDHTASPVYFVKDKSRKPEKKINMLLPDGTDYTGHAGGISVAGDYVYVADGGKRRLLVYLYQDLKDAADGAGVAAIGEFKTAVSDEDSVRGAFVTQADDKLIVGEFYRAVDYPTPDSHKVITKAGDYQQAIGVVYQLNADAEFGIEEEPVSAFTLPDQAQGMCFDNGKVYVSTSWGASKSHILVYDASKAQNQGTLSILGRELPYVSYDSAALEQDKLIAPMAEEIVILNGKMYVMCESASNKYIFGKFTSAKWCHATDLQKFMKK